MKDKDLTGYCGLYCGDCIRYRSKAAHLAAALLEEISQTHFAEYAEVKKAHAKAFENFGSLVGLLKAISDLNCEIPCGAGGDGCGGNCAIIACKNERGLDGCWACDDVARCDKFEFLKPFHGDAPLRNLRKIREQGIDHWAEGREKCYPWL